MPDLFDLNLPQSIKDKFADGTQLTTEEAQSLEELVKQLDVGDNSINKSLSPIPPAPAGFALAAGTVAVKQKMARIKINTEVRVKWSGTSSRVERRAVYKVLNVTANVDSADAQKWAALLACIAGSTWLTAFLWGLAFGPVGWAVWAAAAVASTLVCFSQISPDDFKNFTGGEVSVDEEKDNWG
jgi:hypothetical protein